MALSLERVMGSFRNLRKSPTASPHSAHVVPTMSGGCAPEAQPRSGSASSPEPAPVAALLRQWFVKQHVQPLCWRIEPFPLVTRRSENLHALVCSRLCPETPALGYIAAFQF